MSGIKIDLLLSSQPITMTRSAKSSSMRPRKCSAYSKTIPESNGHPRERDNRTGKTERKVKASKGGRYNADGTRLNHYGAIDV